MKSKSKRERHLDTGTITTDSKVSLSLGESINIKKFKRLINQSFFSNKKRKMASEKQRTSQNHILSKIGNYSKPDISNFEIKEEDKS